MGFKTSPQPGHSQKYRQKLAGMLVFALVGVLMNGYAAWKTSKGETLNERIISWHLLEGEHNVFTTHVVLNKIDTFNDILEVKREIKEILKEYEFSHFTVEVELNEETCSLR